MSSFAYNGAIVRVSIGAGAGVLAALAGETAARIAADASEAAARTAAVGGLNTRVTAVENALSGKASNDDVAALDSRIDTAEGKLAGIASGATANASDAALRARASHTGTQAIATVEGLPAALDSKAAATALVTERGRIDQLLTALAAELQARAGGDATLQANLTAALVALYGEDGSSGVVGNLLFADKRLWRYLVGADAPANDAPENIVKLLLDADTAIRVALYGADGNAGVIGNLLDTDKRLWRYLVGGDAPPLNAPENITKAFLDADQAILEALYGDGEDEPGVIANLLDQIAAVRAADATAFVVNGQYSARAAPNGPNFDIVTRNLVDGLETRLTANVVARPVAFDAENRLAIMRPLAGVPVLRWMPAEGTGNVDYPYFADPTIAAFGDSWLGTPPGSGAQSWPGWLDGFYTAGPVRAEAYGGQRTDQIAARMGAVPIVIATTIGGVIPASGSAAICTVPGQPLNHSAPQAGHDLPVSIKGAACILSIDSAGDYTVRRAAAGSAIVMPGNDIAVASMAGSETGGAVLEGGINDLLQIGYSDLTALPGVLTNIENMVGLMDRVFTPFERKNLILGTGLPSDGNWDLGSPQRALINAHYARMQAIYGRRYVHIQSYLSSAAALTDSGLGSPTADDAVDIAAGRIIRRLLLGELFHPNAAGTHAIAIAIARRWGALNWGGMTAV
jgi:hypothetical protein